MEKRGVAVVLRCSVYDASSGAPSYGVSMPAGGTDVANVCTCDGSGSGLFEMKGGDTLEANARGVLLAMQEGRWSWIECRCCGRSSGRMSSGNGLQVLKKGGHGICP